MDKLTVLAWKAMTADASPLELGVKVT